MRMVFEKLKHFRLVKVCEIILRNDSVIFLRFSQVYNSNFPYRMWPECFQISVWVLLQSLLQYKLSSTLYHLCSNMLVSVH
jgi:hypothetical protein